jgi:hypothetical protein
MIDTLKVWTPDYIIKEENKLTFRTDINKETGEILQKQFYNSEDFNLTIDNRGLFIQFSLPKLYGAETNFYPVGYNSYKVVLKTLETTLNDLGILTSLDTFKISRMDLFKNIETKYQFLDYSLVLNSLNLKRTLKRDYGDTYTIMNSLREICFYDKNLETFNKYQKRFFNGNVMRGELRFKTHQENKKRGFDKAIELPEKWNLLKETYHKFMEKVFNREYKSNDEIKNEFLIFSLIREKRFKEVIELLGVKEFIGVKREKLKKVLLEKYTRDGVYKILKRLDEREKELDKYLKDDRFTLLYSELRDKFLERR